MILDNFWKWIFELVPITALSGMADAAELCLKLNYKFKAQNQVIFPKI
jgi:hypothetical protein